MKNLVYVLILLFAAGSATGLHAESFQQKMKRKACDSSCRQAEKKGVDMCTKEYKEKGQEFSNYEPVCKIAGDNAKQQCMSECLSK